MTNIERAGHVATAEIAAVKMLTRLTCSEEDALRELFFIIIVGALEAVSQPPADRTDRP